MEEHTVRLISHKSDIYSRKEFITYISSGGSSREHGCRIGEMSVVSKTIFEYEMPGKRVVINVIDYNHECIDFKLTSADIVYFDFTDDDHGGFRAIGKIIGCGGGKVQWAKQFIESGAHLWYFHGLATFNGKSVLPTVVDTGYNCKNHWMKFIHDQFGITDSIQTTVKLFSKTIMVTPTVINDAPWPVPKMTITMPRFVTIESIKHNRETGEITITFG